MKTTVAGLLLWLAAGSLAAQTLEVKVRSSAGPLPGALVTVLNGAARAGLRRLSDERGIARFVVAPGSHDVRVDGIGFEGVTLRAVMVRADSVTSVNAQLEARPLLLADLEVRKSRSPCRIDPVNGAALARLWEEARKNLDQLVLARNTQAALLRITGFERTLDAGGSVVGERIAERVGRYLQPFAAAKPQALLTEGFVQRDGADWVFYAPDAPLLLSDDFAEASCFRPAVRRAEDGEQLVGVAFRPRSLKAAGIEGTFWMHRESGRLASVAYSYVGVATSADIEGKARGEIAFRVLPNGLLGIERWSIRMPKIARVIGGRIRPDSIVGYQEVGAAIALPEARRAAGLVVRGQVTDGPSGRALSDVQIGLGGGPSLARTGADGRFELQMDGAGEYQLRFRHPRFDLLGLAPMERTVRGASGDTAATRVEMPAQRDLNVHACRDAERSKSATLFAARFVDAEQAVLAGFVFAARWQEISSSGSRIVVEERESSNVADALGIARLCGLPVDRPAELVQPPAKVFHRLAAGRPQLAYVDSLVVR